LNKETFPKVLTVIDTSIMSSSSVFAIRALSSSETLFLSGKDIVSYITRLQSDDVKVREVDFETLKTEGGAPAQPPKQTKEKESAKIEGAAQIAVGVKKEVDFATWYTNVRHYRQSSRVTTNSLILGPYQSRHVRLLQRQWLLYPQTVVI
jgi:prolyl-tRNA synthetase